MLRAGLAIRGGELALLGGITLLSLLLRVHYLSDIPRYTDEIDEILPAIDIVQGRALPLVSGPKHIGAFFDYVLAGAMVVFGRSPELPRAVVLVAGTATVLLTYGYARALGGPPAGLLAAAFLAVSAPHVLLSSRVAWSASLTPLFLRAQPGRSTTRCAAGNRGTCWQRGCCAGWRCSLIRPWVRCCRALACLSYYAVDGCCDSPRSGRPDYFLSLGSPTS